MSKLWWRKIKNKNICAFTYNIFKCGQTCVHTCRRTSIVCIKLLCLDTPQCEMAQTNASSKHWIRILWLPHRPDFVFGTRHHHFCLIYACRIRWDDDYRVDLCSYCQNIKSYVRSDKNKFIKYVFTSIFLSHISLSFFCSLSISLSISFFTTT